MGTIAFAFWTGACFGSIATLVIMYITGGGEDE